MVAKSSLKFLSMAGDGTLLQRAKTEIVLHDKYVVLPQSRVPSTATSHNTSNCFSDMYFTCLGVTWLEHSHYGSLRMLKPPNKGYYCNPESKTSGYNTALPGFMTVKW